MSLRKDAQNFRIPIEYEVALTTQEACALSEPVGPLFGAYLESSHYVACRRT